MDFTLLAGESCADFIHKIFNAVHEYHGKIAAVDLVTHHSGGDDAVDPLRHIDRCHISFDRDHTFLNDTMRFHIQLQDITQIHIERHNRVVVFL